jgi:hypothetical protein
MVIILIGHNMIFALIGLNMIFEGKEQQQTYLVECQRFRIKRFPLSVSRG